MGDISELIRQVPDADPTKGMLFDIGEGQVEAVVARVLEGGRESVAALIDAVKPTVSGGDWKPRYLLHSIAVHSTRPEGRAHQKMVSQAAADALAGDRPKPVKEFLCHVLQVARGVEQVPAIGALLGDEELTEPAAQALRAIREGAAAFFRKALPAAKGRPRLTIMTGLAALKDAPSAPAFREALKDADCDIRLAAARGLSALADPADVPLLLKAADAQGWERIRMADACLSMAEKLAAAGRKDEARKIYASLKESRKDPAEGYIRELCDRALS